VLSDYYFAADTIGVANDYRSAVVLKSAEVQLSGTTSSSAD
jgi:hypothetical protein